MTKEPLPLPLDSFSRALFEDSFIGLLVVNEQGQIERSNPRASQILGIPQENLTSVASLLPESMQEAHERWLRDFFDEHGSRRMGARLIEYVHPDRSTRLLDISLTPITTEGHRLVLVQISDATAHHALGQTHRFLAAIVENSIDAIVSADPEGRITSWNRGAEILFGYSAEEIVGQSASVLLPAGESLEQQHLTREARITPQQGLDLVRRRKDGRQVEISASLFPIVDARRGPQGIAAVVRDISGPKQVERELLAVKERYERLFASSPDAHLVMSLEGGEIFDCNRAAEIILKRSKEEILGRTPIDISPPFQPCGRPSAELVAEKITKILQGESLCFEWVHCQADGTEFWVEVNASQIELDRQKVIFVVWRDINERKERQRIQQLLAAIVEGSTDAILSKDLDGRITSWNRGAELLFGYSAEETLGKTIAELLTPERLAAEEQELLGKLQRGEEIEPFDTLRHRKDGREIHVSVQISPIRDEHGKVIKASTILRDITKAQLAAAELKRSNQELEQFAYVASHDLQEPLRMVANYTELLAERYRGKLDEKADRYIHYASDGARRMQALVADLLAYSRVGSQGKPLVPVDSNRILKHVLVSLGESIKESKATIRSGDLPPVMADETQLFQLFQNLIHNALKFRTETPPEVSISAIPGGEFWEFAIRDNGIGFDMRYAERIFQMFQRLHERGKFAGSGIGLAIVRRIVERHGGKIRVESRPQQGTTFYFTLAKVGELR